MFNLFFSTNFTSPAPPNKALSLFIMQKRRRHLSHTGEASDFYNIEGSCAGNVWVEKEVLFLEAIKTSHVFISQKHSISFHNIMMFMMKMCTCRVHSILLKQ